MKILLILLMIPLLALSLSAEDQKTISLDQFLALVRKSHPAIKKEKLESEIRKSERDSLAGKKDILVNLTPSYTYAKPVAEPGMGDFTPSKTTSYGLKMSATKNFWLTGGQLSLSLENNRTDYTTKDVFTGEDSSKNNYGQKATLTYFQPLLKNFRGVLDRLNYDLKNYDIEIAKLQADENNEAFILDLSTKYLEWSLLHEQKQIAQKRIKLAQNSLKKNRRMRKNNLVDKMAIYRSEDEVNLAKQSFAEIQASWKAKQSEIAIISDSKEIYSLSPFSNSVNIELVPKYSVVMNKWFSKSRLLKILKQNKKKLFHARNGYENNLLPDLGLQFSGTLQDQKTSFSDSLKSKKPELYTGFVFSMPLGNNASENDLKGINLQIKKLDLEISNISRKMKSELSQVLIRLEEYKKILLLNKKQLIIAKKKTVEELKKYRQGRGDFFYVIQNRDQEYNAKYTYAQNNYTYQLLLLQYKALMNELL